VLRVPAVRRALDRRVLVVDRRVEGRAVRVLDAEVLRGVVLLFGLLLLVDISGLLTFSLRKISRKQFYRTHVCTPAATRRYRRARRAQAL
jgi:hypothetical protein